MRCLLLLALAACATDPPPPEREPPPPLVRDYRAAVTDEPPPIRRREEPPPITADVAERARQDALATQKAQAEAQDAQRKAAEDRAAAEAAKHASDCRASFGTRLKTIQGELGAAVAKKAEIETRCRRLQPRCVIGGGHSVCAGVSADDSQFYESICMALPYGDQIPVVDHTESCDDVDPLPLHVTMKTTAAEVDALRRAKP